MKYSALIVEDEKMNRNFLVNLLSEFCPELEVADIATNYEEAVQKIEGCKPDIVFMDIELQSKTGFDVLEKLSDCQSQVIFTTAYDHYAIRAIRFSAVDYILKPINFEELREAVKKAIASIESKEKNSSLELLLRNVRKQPAEDFSISLATAEGIEFVPLSQIIRLEAKGPYTIFYMKHRPQLMVSRNLKEYETQLSDHGFFRLHNSFMVNMKEVKRMVKADGGYAVMNDESMISISPRKKEEFMSLMAQRLV